MATVGDNARPNPWRLRLIVAACSALLVYGLALSVLHFQRPSQGARLLRYAVPFIVALAATYGAAGWWAAQTWQALWRHGRDRWERIVFDRGVRFLGLLVAAILVAGLAWLGWRIGAGEPRWLTAGVLTGLVVGLPVGLHLGYLGGLVLARVSGIEETPIAVLAQAPPDRSAASELPLGSAADGSRVKVRWQQPLSKWGRGACVAGGLAGAAGTAILTPWDLALPVASVGLICVLVGWKGLPLVASVRYATGGMGARVQEGRQTIQLRGRVAIAVAVVSSALVAGLSGMLPRLLFPTCAFLAALVVLACALRFVLSACPRCEKHFFLSSRRTGALTQCRHCSLPLRVVQSPPNTRPKRRDV